MNHRRDYSLLDIVILVVLPHIISDIPNNRLPPPPEVLEIMDPPLLVKPYNFRVVFAFPPSEQAFTADCNHC